MKQCVQEHDGSQPAEEQAQSVESGFIEASSRLFLGANPVQDARHYSQIHDPLVLITVTDWRGSCMLFCSQPNPSLIYPQWLRNAQPWTFSLTGAAAQLQFWPIWFSGSKETISARHFAQRVAQPQMAASANSQRRETQPDWATAVRHLWPWCLDRKLCFMTCRQADFFSFFFFGVRVSSLKFASDHKEQLQSCFVRCVSTHLVFFFYQRLFSDFSL